MKEIVMFIPGIMMILLGIAIGMYISTQLKCHIKRKTFNDNLKKYEEKKTKQ